MVSSQTPTQPLGAGGQAPKSSEKQFRLAKIKLPPRIYNILRSFVESSEKPQYNRPRLIGGGVQFIKSGKWVVQVINETVTLTGPPLTVKVEADYVTETLTIFFDSYKIIRGRTLRVLRDGEEIVEADSASFVADVPYSTTVSLEDIAEKLRFYYWLSKNVQILDVDLTQ